MSKRAADHHKRASEHLTRAAHHHKKAARYHEAARHEAAVHHAHIASAHGFRAGSHAEKAFKAYVEHLHLLTREGSHRVKNLLSLVQAIAHQTASSKPEDFIGCFTERIKALAANQDLLVRNGWHGVEVEDLVRAQLAHFADLVGSRVTLNGPPKLRLIPVAAEAIGFSLHELTTNAAKYGALSRDVGHVDISWGTEGDAFTMTWAERDGPPVSPPERPGFGSTIITSLANLSIGGDADLDFGPSGVTWRFTCPAANVLESA